jgi:hypothetical protein
LTHGAAAGASGVSGPQAVNSKLDKAKVSETTRKGEWQSMGETFKQDGPASALGRVNDQHGRGQIF